MRSWKSEVIADRSGKWVGNGLRFATKAEAEVYVADLMDRWTLVTRTRVVEDEDPVNSAIVDGCRKWLGTREGTVEQGG